MVDELRFRAMGSDCSVIAVDAPPGTAERGRLLVEHLEALWSRFRDDSEVSRLNRSGGRPVRVSPETAELVQRAADAWRLTGGSFDATVLGAVLDAGYDRSFEELGSGGERPVLSRFRAGASEVEIDGLLVTVAAGVGFDPGGIGKGLAADMVVTALVREGAGGVCANLGGDVRVAGASPGGGAWTVAVEHEWRDDPLALVGLGAGAVATSTTLKRRWEVGGEERHHLIDPATGVPSASDLNLAAVISAEAWAAEVLAKAVLLRGSEHPFDILGGTGAEGLAVTASGRVLATPGWASFTGGVAPPSAIAVPGGR